MSIAAVYPGSFDPPTNGHIDIIKRARDVFHPLVVAVAHNPQKKCFFSLEERVALLREVLQDQDVIVEGFEGLLVDYVKAKGSKVVIRGLRAVSDFEYEFQMALTNAKLCADIETIFMMASEPYSYVSSRIIKEIAALGGRLSDFVPPVVVERLNGRIR